MTNARLPGWVSQLFAAVFASLLGTVPATGKDLAPYDFTTFFDITRLVKIDLKLATADWDKMRVQHRLLVKTLRTDIPPSDQTSPFDYVPAQLTINGIEIGKVAIRKKGFVGSLDHERPSLKIQLSRYKKKKKFAGLDTLTLNNNRQDPSRIHQLIGYQLFRAAGLTASQCNLAIVRVNGKSLGIYSNVESLDKHFLRRAFKGAKGTLYEGTVCDFANESLIRFEHKVGSKKNRKNIAKVVTALTAPLETRLKKVGKHLDLQRFLRFWAMEVLVGHWDGYVSNRNNYFVYVDSKSDQLQLLPWGLDQLASDRNPFWEWGFNPPKSVKADAAIPRQLYQVDAGREKYFAVVRELLDTVWDEKKITEQIDALQDLIEPHTIIRGDGGRRHAGRLQNFIRRRRQEVLAEIDDGKFPDWQLAPRELPRNLEKIADIEGSFAVQRDSNEKGKDGFIPATGSGQLTLKQNGQTIAITSPTFGIRQNGRGSVTLRMHRPAASAGETQTVEVTFPRPRLTDKQPEASFRIDIFASPAQGNLLEANSPEPLGQLGGYLTITKFGTKPGDRIEGRLESEAFRWLPPKEK